MKTNIITLTIFMVVIALGLMSSSAGRGAVSGEQRTGAPGENATTCSQCHNSGSFGTSVSMFLSDLDGNALTTYIPEESYLLNLSIDAASGTPSGFGFQMVALNESEDPVNSWGDNIDSELRVIDLGGRDYVEQTGTLSTGTWAIPWTGPATATGAVTFYACGNNVNVNGNTGGDEAATGTFTISEDIGASSNDQTILTAHAYPNPVSNAFNIANPKSISQIQLFDVNSNLVLNSRQTDQNFYVGDLQAGSYILVYLDANGKKLKAERIIKI